MIHAIENLARLDLGFYPTPITDARRLSSTLGGPRILIKREDLSGLALGGNKCRMFEFILAEAKKQGATAVISTASSQSNFCLQMAAAARKLGMKPRFVLLRGVHNETQGNLLLQNILDSDVKILEISDMREAFAKGGTVSRELDKAADELRASGHKPFTIRHDASDVPAILGCAGWVNGADEIMTQLKELGVEVQYLVLAVAGSVTTAGLVLGSKYLKAEHRIRGISVLKKEPDAVAAALETINATSAFLGLDTKVTPQDFEITDAYIGKGYGIPTTECLDAIRITAQTEGIYLDPVYTGKAMAALIDLARKGEFKPTDTVLFIHTGGIPALFEYHAEIAA